MYGQTLKVHGQYLAKGMALPKNTETVGNGALQELSGTLGGVEIVAEAETSLTLKDGGILTVTLEHGDSGDFEPLSTLCKVTGGTAIDAGEVLGRYVVPTDAARFVRAKVATTDSGAGGSITVYPHYLAR